MPTPPSIEAVLSYLASTNSGSWGRDDVEDVLAAATAAQVRWIKLPTDADPLHPDPYPADLAEALKRRVAYLLAVRSLPLGTQTAVVENMATIQQVGMDPVIRRLEAPWRRVVVG